MIREKKTATIETKRHLPKRPRTLAAVAVLVAVGLLPRGLAAHCDAVDGPVVADAEAALARESVTPVLKWVRPGDEPKIREAFRETLAVRKESEAAGALADRWFFETLVRVHRAGEGAPFTGLKPAGTDPGPGVELVDRALESGEAERVVAAVTREVEEGVRRRMKHALQARARADRSVREGREFTHAYVEVVHYVKRLLLDARSKAHPASSAAGSAHEHD